MAPSSPKMSPQNNGAPASKTSFFGKYQARIGFGILTIAYGFLYPGLFMENNHVHTGLFSTENELTQSTMQLTRFLWAQGPGYWPPAFLLTFFSISGPFLKGIVILFAWYRQSSSLLWFVSRVSKFQFLDSFAMFLSYVYLNNPVITTEIKAGVYYFLTYCVLSVIGTQLITTVGEHAGQRKSVRGIWLPVAVVQIVSIVVLYFNAPIMGVSAVLFGSVRLIGTRATLRGIIAKLNPIPGWMMIFTICIMPMVTYVVLPVLLRFGPPALLNVFGGKQRLYSAMDICHDWAMGDVWLLAFITGWLSFNASDETTSEIMPVGSYFTVLYGLSGSVLMFVYEYNATLVPRSTVDVLRGASGVSSAPLGLLDDVSDPITENNEAGGAVPPVTPARVSDDGVSFASSSSGSPPSAAQSPLAPPTPVQSTPLHGGVKRFPDGDVPRPGYGDPALPARNKKSFVMRLLKPESKSGQWLRYAALFTTFIVVPLVALPIFESTQKPPVPDLLRFKC